MFFCACSFFRKPTKYFPGIAERCKHIYCRACWPQRTLREWKACRALRQIHLYLMSVFCKSIRIRRLPHGAMKSASPPRTHTAVAIKTCSKKSSRRAVMRTSVGDPLRSRIFPYLPTFMTQTQRGQALVRGRRAGRRSTITHLPPRAIVGAYSKRIHTCLPEF